MPQWLTILGLLGGLYLTFYVMAKGAAAYERRRLARERSEKSEGPMLDEGEEQ